MVDTDTFFLWTTICPASYSHNMPFGRCSYQKHCLCITLSAYIWSVIGLAGNQLCLFHRRTSQATQEQGLLLATCLFQLPHEQQMKGLLDVHRSLQTHPLHWAQPQQMAQHCGAEWRGEKRACGLGGARLCLCTLGTGCVWGPIRANGCFVAVVVCLRCSVVKLRSEIISIDHGRCFSSVVL